MLEVQFGQKTCSQNESAHTRDGNYFKTVTEPTINHKTLLQLEKANMSTRTQSKEKERYDSTLDQKPTGFTYELNESP